jgi:hypothetical protein
MATVNIIALGILDHKYREVEHKEGIVQRNHYYLHYNSNFAAYVINLICLLIF